MRQKCAHPETHITQPHITLETAPTLRLVCSQNIQSLHLQTIHLIS